MEILTKETAYDGYFKINKMTVKNSNGVVVNREQFELHDAVAALVYNVEKDNFVFVKQFRTGPEKIMLEIPAGKMDIDGESPEDTVKREIVEEIGYRVDTIKHMYSYYPAPGSSTEKIHLFYTEVNEQIEEGGGVETEDIEIIEIPFNELTQNLREGTFDDGKSIIAILHWMQNAL